MCRRSLDVHAPCFHIHRNPWTLCENQGRCEITVAVTVAESDCPRCLHEQSLKAQQAAARNQKGSPKSDDEARGEAVNGTNNKVDDGGFWWANRKP
jgi:transposase